MIELLFLPNILECMSVTHIVEAENVSISFNDGVITAAQENLFHDL